MRRAVTYILFALFTLPVAAWNWWPLPMDEGDPNKDTLAVEVGVSAVASSGRFAPFWMHSNAYGKVSASPFSGSLNVVLEKPATRPGRWWDYDFAVDVSGIAHSATPGNPKCTTLRRFPYWQTERGTAIINRLYAHARLYIFDITAGVVPMEGCNPEVDRELSVGDWLFSGNSPSMSRISIGIDRYTAVPGLFGYLEVRGGMTHAWFTDNMYISGSYLHHKFIGGRAGGNLPINVSFEFHHAAQWGGYSPVYGDLGNDLHALMNVFTAHAGGNSFNESFNSQGNHLISQLWSVIGKGDGWRISLTWQNFIEDDFMYIGQGKNLPDGLWGLRFEQSRWPYIASACLEYLGTSDQSGPLMIQDGLLYSGADSYYQNSIYTNGWNYQLHTIGTPFITSPLYNRGGEIMTTNNRAKVWHLGIKGDVFTYRYRALFSHARNYYMYHSGGDIYAEQSRNMAWLIEVKKTVPQAWGLDFGLRVAGDIGTQFGNTVGAMVTISKRGILWQSNK